MEAGWGGEGGMLGNIGLLASHLSHLTRNHRPQKAILPKLFGRVYSVAGLSADPDKIDHIGQAGRPETIEEVRPLLQAAAYNTKYGFNHHKDLTYKEVTVPLRQLLEKDATYRWDDNKGHQLPDTAQDDELQDVPGAP